MSAEYKLTEVNDVLRLEIIGNEDSAPEDFDNALNQAKTVLDEYEDKELQTFVNVRHEAELEFFISRGFYVANTMLIMEKDLEEDIDYISSDVDVDINLVDINNKEEIHRYLRANKLGFDGVQDPEEQIIYQISQPNGAIYVAEIEGEIVSSVMVWDIDNKTAATENVFTVPQYRDKHIAGCLMTFVLSELKKRNISVARLSVYGDDMPAHRLYMNLGYHITDSNYELRY